MQSFFIVFEGSGSVIVRSVNSTVKTVRIYKFFSINPFFVTFSFKMSCFFPRMDYNDHLQMAYLSQKVYIIIFKKIKLICIYLM